MTRFALTIEYDGRPFMGWQRQSHGPSVQAAIEQAVFAVTGEHATVYAAGRTDAGVHALGMRAHVDVAKPLAAFRLGEALNALLRPTPISILGCEEVADDWHARFSCIRRAYEYRIVNRRAPLTWEKGLAWQVPHPLDAGAMQAGADRLVGLHDFTTFRAVHCQSASPVKTVEAIEVRRSGDRITIYAAARSFLHHQVRSIVGTLAFVGQGRWTPEDVTAALEARDRQRLPLNAPADGLWFLRADYPGDRAIGQAPATRPPSA